MSPRDLAAAILCALALAPPAPALADPAYLPPFLDRAPALGDRWLYAAYDFFGNHAGHVMVEAVEVEETAEGWRYLVEDQLELLPEIASAAVQPVHRNEWFFDGRSTWRGDRWADGVLSVDLRKPLRVLWGRSRFGHIGWPKPVKRRGRISQLPSLPGSDPPVRMELRLGDRSHPTLTVGYDLFLGRVSWTDRFGLRRELASAVIDGAAWEAPFTPFTPRP